MSCRARVNLSIVSLAKDNQKYYTISPILMIRLSLKIQKIPSICPLQRLKYGINRTKKQPTGLRNKNCRH
jgi:hypothetical protein